MRLKRTLVATVSAFALVFGSAVPALAGETVTVSGTVITPGGEGVEYANVELDCEGTEEFEGESSQFLEFITSSQTNEQGAYSLAVDPADCEGGSFVLSADGVWDQFGKVYEFTYLGDTTNLSEATRFSLIADYEAQPIELVPAVRGTASGLITEQGNPTEQSESLSLYSLYNYDDEDVSFSVWEYRGSTEVEAGGEFSLNLPPGIYTYEVSGIYYGGGNTRPDPGSLTASNSFTITENQVTSGLNLNLPAKSVITGTVLTGSEAESYAWVQVLRWNEDWEVWDYASSTTTAEDGSYSVRVGPGTYTIEVDGRYLGGGTSEPTSPAAGNSVTVTDAGSTILAPDIVLPTRAKVSGAVAEVGNGIRAPGVEIVAWRAHEWPEYDDETGEPTGSSTWYWEWYRDAYADSEGNYELKLPAGQYVFQVDGEFEGGDSPTGAPGAAGASSAITLDWEQTLTNNLTVAARVQVSGTVLEYGGAAASYASVNAYRWVNGYWYNAGYAYNEDGGNYSIRLAPGTYAFHVNGEYLGGEYSLPAGPDHSTNTREIAGATDGLNLTLSQRFAVSGTVKESDGTPVAHEYVEVYRWNEAEEYWSYAEGGSTEENGDFELRLPKGQYTFSVDGSYLGGTEYQPESPNAQNSKIVDDASVSGIQLNIAQRYLVTGTLTEQDGSAATDAVVLASRDEDSFEPKRAYANGNGEYELRLKQGNTYSLSFFGQDPSYWETSQLTGNEPKVSNAGTVNHQFADVLPEVRGKVTGSSGAAVPGATVHLYARYSETSDWWSTGAAAETDAQGNFTIRSRHLIDVYNSNVVYTLVVSKTDHLDTWLGNSTAAPGTNTAGNSFASVPFGQAATGKNITLQSEPGAPEPPQLAVPTKPTIKGTAKVGVKVSATLGSWKSDYTVSYQWLRNGVSIKGATKASYSVAPADAGKKLSVKVTAKHAGVADKFVTSAAKKVAKAKPKITAKAKAGAKGKATITVKVALPGTAAKATKVKVKVFDGKKVVKKSVTVKNGKATVKLSKLKKGAHTLKVTFAGNAAYSTASATAKTKVK